MKKLSKATTLIAIALTVAGLLSLAPQRCLADDNPFTPYGPNYLMPGYFPDGSNLQQFKFQISQKFTALDFGQIFEILDGLYLEGAYEQTSFGDVEEQSAPFYHDFKPSSWLEYNFNDWAAARYAWLHGSTGVAGTDSRSWDRHAVGGDFYFTTADTMLNIELHPLVWWAFDVADDNPELLDIRAVSGRVGFEVSGRAVWREGLFGFDWLGDAALGKNQVLAQLGVNTIPWVKDWFLTAQMFKGTGNSLTDYTQEATDFGVGLTFVPRG